MSALRILGLDPGLSNLGLACIEMDVETRELELLRVVLLETAKDTKKKHMREKADDLRRLCILESGVRAVLAEWSPHVISFEECPQLRSNTVTRKVAMAWGAAHALCSLQEGVLSFEYEPVHLKIVATGKKQATKPEIIAAVVEWFPQFVECGIVPSKQEHVADAVAAAVAASQDAAVITLANAMASMLRQQ